MIDEFKIKRLHSVSKQRCCTVMLVVLGALSSSIVFAVAQEESSQAKSNKVPKSSDASKETTLTEGLLDLLDSGSDDEPMESTEPTTTMQEGLTPRDVGLDGEDLGEASSNPLRAVRQSMMIAAGYLERGVTDRSTQVLQGDIVQRLDELIEQIETSNQNSPKPSEQEKSQESAQDQSSKFERRQREVTASEQAPDEEEVEQNLQKGTPGQTGVGANVVEQMRDPQALQKAVWGQLPER
ncbi:MAG: hypothetical protein AAGG44_16155, partial [Planctomycetota bacterium]